MTDIIDINTKEKREVITPEEIIQDLPPLVKDCVLEIKQQNPLADQGLILCSTLAVAALGAQCCYDVIDSNETRHNLSLFILTLADSGLGKSHILNLLTEQINDWVDQKEQDYYFEYELWEDKKKEYKKRKDKALKANQKFTEKEPVAPIHPRSFSTTATWNGVLENLKTMPCFSIFTGEGGTFLSGHSMRSQETRSEITANLNALWSSEPVARNTGMSDGRFTLTNRRSSLYLSIQPAMADMWEDERLQKQGFWARFLAYRAEKPAIEQDRFAKRVQNKKPVLRKATNRFVRQVISYLEESPKITLANKQQKLGDTNFEDPDPRKLDLDKIYINDNCVDPLNEFGTWCTNKEKGLFGDETHKAHLQRLVYQSIKISGILAAYAYPGSKDLEVQKDQIDLAIKTAKWFWQEREKLSNLGVVEDEIVELAQKVFAWMKGKKVTDNKTVWKSNDLSRGTVLNKHSSAVRKLVLGELESRKLVSIAKIPGSRGMLVSLLVGENTEFYG